MLEHDLSQAVDAGFVILWVRDRLFIKLKDLMSTEAALKPGLAAKMFDLMNVLGERTFGRVGCTRHCRRNFRIQECSRLVREG